MARLIRFLCATVAVILALSGRPSPAESLRLVTDSMRPYEELGNVDSPGFSVEVLKHVFADIGQDASFETFPAERSWLLVARGESDGMFTVLRTEERERVCTFSDEPLKQERWAFFIRAADVGKLNFSSFDDLIGHNVAVHEPVPGLFQQPTAPVELWHFLRDHQNMVNTNGGFTSLRLLAAGRVDYVYMNLSTGLRDIAVMGLSGKFEPLLTGKVMEEGYYVCFNKTRVRTSLVDSFSQALRQFKQTEAYQQIYRKYFP